MTVELYYKNEGLSVNELSDVLDQLWEELKRDSALRFRAQEVGVNLDQLSHLERKDAIKVNQKGSGLDPATTAIVVAFAPVAAEILLDLWKHVFLPKILKDKGEDALEEKDD